MGTIWTRIEGGKHFLSQIEVGQTIVYDGPHPWRSLQTIAISMREDFGAVYRFRTYNRKGYRTITRVQ